MDKENYKAPIEVLRISQRGKIFYIGKMVFSEFENSYTPSPAEYKLISYSQEAEKDERFKDLSIGIAEHLEKEQGNIAKGFQRKTDPKRIEQIKNYVLENEYGIIPNSIIVSVNTVEVDSQEDFEVTVSDPTNKKAILFNNNLYIPKIGKPFLIIDGQHRVEGCEKLPSHIKSDMELIFTFINNADPSTQAQLFTTINYEARRVSKSYLYHILGEFKIESSEYTFLHEIVKLLNEVSASPLYDRVKMLGKSVSPKNSLSQAFLVESFYLLICTKYKEVKFLNETALLKIPVFRYHYVNKEYRKVMPKFIIMYLYAIKNLLKKISIEWEDKDSHILLKTVGMGAAINIIPNVYISLVCQYDLINCQHLIAEKLSIKNIEDVLKNITKVNLKNEPQNEYSKGSSQGLVRKLAEKLWKEIVVEIPTFLGLQKAYIDWFNASVVEKKQT
ncbi:MAG TPA: DGQHR domain-containing protein [Candidatus Wunengus sp. YC64]|uniref:DGQHR domain-containing protein n=1 Tax=Candidatus Wunengus sp. YC64 TaxID=3367700 RepID=UPI00402954C1